MPKLMSSIKEKCHGSSFTASREMYIDILRIVAIFGVIMIHVTSDGGWDKLIAPRSYEWYIYALYNSVVRFSVPVFIMITGALYGSPRKTVDLKKLYTSNILRLFLALLFWYWVYKIAQTGAGRLWYVFMCISLYIIIPFLRMVTESEKMTRYYIILSLFFSYGIPTVLYLPIWEYFPSAIRGMIQWIEKGFYGYPEYHLGFGCYSYFVIGYICSTVEINKSILKKVVVLGTVGFSYTALGTLICSYSLNSKLVNFLHSQSLNVMAEAIFIFIMIRYLTDKLQAVGDISKILALSADAVFGVYLLHTVVQHYLSIIVKPLEWNPIWMCFVMTFMIFFISLIFSLMIRKISVLGKYIV